MIRDKILLKKICQEKLLKEFKELYPNQKDNPIKHMPSFINKLNEELNKKLEEEYNSTENLNVINIINTIDNIIDFDELYNNMLKDISKLIQYSSCISYIPIFNQNVIRKHITYSNFSRCYFDLALIIKEKKNILKYIYVENILLSNFLYNEIYEKIEKTFVEEYNIKTKFYLTKKYEHKNITSVYKNITTKLQSQIVNKIKNSFTIDDLAIIFLKNEKYANCCYFIEQKDYINNEFNKYVSNYRQSGEFNKRKFILHVGDTNTGKTYEALQDLKQAKSGIYLAPLRLLALEVQENLLNDNIKCSLLTGEEIDIDKEAKHISETIEELNIDEEYEVCIIDEAQMIDDKQRGWAWSRALYKVKANRIHVCMSKDALPIIIKIIENCNDEYEIKNHIRTTKLEFDNSFLQRIEDIRENDAYVVFSRKSVINVAMDLENNGIKASIIYGSLPYAVRKNEIRKFQEKETTVLVTTDAIGMGMNLPIHRIVFLETTKYDGTTNRYLTHKEVKQIAGRAGRKGLFDIGYVSSNMDKNYIKELLSIEYEPIKHISLNFPDNIINFNVPLSFSLRLWKEFEIDKNIFKKSDIDNIIMLCDYIEDYFDLDHKTTLKFSTIPFDSNNVELLNLWKELIFLYHNNLLENYKKMIDINLKDLTIEELELYYKKFDIITSFMRILNKMKDYNIIMQKKELISTLLIDKIKSLKKQTKKCTKCNKKIPLNYPYKICQDCYKKMNTTNLLLVEEDEY